MKKEIDAVKGQHMKDSERLQKQLDSIAIAEHLLAQTYPWEHFLAAVDNAAELQGIDRNEVGESDKKAKPSTRAMYLVDGKVGESLDDVQLRAYQIDHALLDTQVKMLQKEAEGYEKLLESQETLTTFLSDNVAGVR